MVTAIPPSNTSSVIRAVLRAECELEMARRELDRAYETLAAARRLYSDRKAGLMFTPPHAPETRER
jgi:hypothetical protein